MTLEMERAESSWTPEELQSVREALLAAVTRLKAELDIVDTEMAQAVALSTLEVLHDELDVAAHRSELLQDAVQAENSSAILAQTEHVLARLDRGLYGVCEACSGEIGRPRLEAFPRATLCMTCVA
jgi:DnaK suppressor protein